jgi:hypothetical protein
VRRLRDVPASHAGKTGMVAAAVAVAVASGVGVALASAGPAAQVPARATAPVVAPAAARPQPGALLIAEPHTAGRSMNHQLMVRISGWAGARPQCRPAARPLADTQAAKPVTGGCGTPQLATAAAPPGYRPAQLKAYLHLRGTGQGESVAIVDAFDNPYATRDIAAYSKQFRLPLPCGRTTAKGCFDFSVVHPFGFAGVDSGWALESDLDVQMVHAIAPDAAITLVESYDNSFDAMFQAVRYAGTLKPAPAAISGSWGGAEFTGETAGDSACALARTVCVFSTGDQGNPGEWPAFDPYALAVGGTHLELTAHGQVAAEEGWCCGPFPGGATGGGVSQVEARPPYQARVNPFHGRGTPDVSFDADPVTGVPVHDTFGLDGQNGWFEVGGTSVGAPAWSAILAAADQLRAHAHETPLAGAGFGVQKLLYGRAHQAGLADITVGADNLLQCTGPARTCQAHPGYDLVTGWGSPRRGIDAALAGARHHQGAR